MEGRYEVYHTENYYKKTGFRSKKSWHCFYITYSVKTFKTPYPWKNNKQYERHGSKCTVPDPWNNNNQYERHGSKCTVPDPWNNNKKSRGQVVRDNVEAHLSGENQLEARGTVVHS